MSRYTLQRKLGAGGMGDVWEAVDASLGRRVAVKTLKPELAADPQMFARFRQEAEAAAGLGHPNIIQVIELTNDDPPLLVMEMLEGMSLRDLLRAEGRLPPPRAVFIALQILSALAAAHRARIVHRDIKPANVFVVKTLAVADFVKVLDFGIAKLLDRTLPDGSSALTAWGDVLGTTAYMAPEQALGMPIDARADLFSVGAVLFELLSGARARRPGPGGKSDLRDVAFTPCARLADVAPSIDGRLAGVVDRALALDPAQRFASAEEMVAALTPFAQQGGASTSTANVDVMRTVRDAPPTMTVPAPAPAPAPTPRQMVVHAAVQPKPSTPFWVWLLVGIPLGAAAIIGVIALGIFLLNQRYDREKSHDQAKFLGSYVPPACVRPNVCSDPPETDDSYVVSGVTYGVCRPPATKNADANYEVGDYVFAEVTLQPSVVKVIGMRGTEYAVQYPSGSTQHIGARTILGRICVTKDR